MFESSILPNNKVCYAWFDIAHWQRADWSLACLLEVLVDLNLITLETFDKSLSCDTNLLSMVVK